MTEDQTTDYRARVVIIGEPGAIPVPDHAVCLQTSGSVTPADLLANAIRMRPDIIRIGNVLELEHVALGGLWRIGKVAVADDRSGYAVTRVAWVPAYRLVGAVCELMRWDYAAFEAVIA